MKITTILLSLLCTVLFAQQKSTGVVNLSSNMSASLVLDNGTSTVVLTLTGPNDRWFALQFGSFTSGMQPGTDVVYWNNVTLVDARHQGQGIEPEVDASNDWQFISNTNNSPSVGQRTLVYSRLFNTGDVNDYTFNFSNTTIDLAWARMDSPTYSLSYHGASNRGLMLDVPLTTLGTRSFTLDDSKLYPNPSNGNLTIKTKTFLTNVNVYTLTGVFVKKITVEDNSENVELTMDGLQTGVYLLELQNDSEKSWKKIIVN